MPSIGTLDLVGLHQAIVDTLVAGGIEQCYPCWFDNIEPPCVVVVGAPDGYVQLDMAFRQGTGQVNVILQLFGKSETREGQEQIMSWLSMGTGAPSVIDALRPLRSGVPDSSFGLDGVTFTFGATRYASSVIYPEGSNNRYALAELDLRINIPSGG